MKHKTIHIRDPWTMPYREHADILIDALHKQIGPRHPLYRRKAFPLAVSRELGAVLFETDDEPDTYAVVYMEWGPHILARKRSRNPKSEVLIDRRAVQERIDRDQKQWLTQFLPPPEV